MKKITLTIDDYLIAQKDRIELTDIIKKSSIKSSVVECDTHGMGGIAWFPTDLIIAVVGLTAAGFFSSLGEDIYKQLKNKIKKILSSNKSSHSSIYYSYISFKTKNVVLYFEINIMTVYSIDVALDKMISDFEMIEKEVNRLIEFNPEKITGKFRSITFIFDDEESKWVISHFNIHP